MKKALSLILSFVMVLSVFAPISAFAGSIDMGEMVEKNPLYAGTYEAKGSLTGLTTASTKKTYNGKTYISEGKEFYNQAKKYIDARSSGFTLYYYSKTRLHPNSVLEMNTMRNKILAMLEDMLMGATDDQLSVNCYDGDYSRWALDSFGVKQDGFTIDYTGSNYYLYTFKLMITYNDTAAQEAKVDQAVDAFIKTIQGKDYSDYEILGLIHDYICNKTTYDYDALKNVEAHRHAFTAYGALVLGECVCQGYSLAFYRICKELGYKVRFVSSDPNIGCHAWNIVQIDNKYYFVDLTWDDGNIDDGDTDNARQYFLVDYDDLRANDKSSGAHTLFDELYDNSYFNKNYFNQLDDESYDYDKEGLISTCPIKLSKILYNYSGAANKPAVTVSDKDGIFLTEGVDYTISYSANTNCGRAKTVITGLGDYNGLKSTRVFNIRPGKMGKLSTVSGTRTSSSLTLTWAKPAGNVSGYQIQKYENNEWKHVAYINSASTLSYKVSSLSAAKAYKFRIRAFTYLTKLRYYGEVSASYTTCTVPKTISISSLSTKSKAVTVKWKKTTCTGYEIQYSQKSNMSSSKTVTVKSSTATSKKIGSLKKGKKYYFRIRAYKTNGSVTYKAPWSGKKSIVVK